MSSQPYGGAQGRPPGGVYGVLHVVGGNDRGKQFTLNLPETAIGRGADQSMILSDIAVSRRHFKILIEGDRYRMQDLGSGNGTLINGVRQPSVLLNDGDQIEIGNTLLRLEHAPSRAQAAAPPPGPPLHASPDNATMMGDAAAFNLPIPPAPAPPPAYAAPAPAPYAPPPPQMDPFPPPQPDIAMPPPQRPSIPSLPPVINTGARSAPSGMSTGAKIGIIAGATVALLLIVGVVLKFALGGPGAQKLYEDGTKAFQAQDYVRAKSLFSAAVQADPELAPAAKFLKQCDVEIHARGALKTANGLAAQKRWVDELKVLDTIDRSSEAFKEAETLRKQAVPAAIEDYLAEAKDVMKDDPETARQKVDLALTLDPEDESALKMEQELKGGAPAGAGSDDSGGKHGRHADAGEKKGREKAPAPVPVASSDRADRHTGGSKSNKRGASHGGGGDDDDDLAPVQNSGGGGSVDLLSSKAGAPYKAKDFAGAASALKSLGKSGESLASQVSSLGSVYAKAEIDKSKNVQAAVNEYQQAMAIDARIGKGTHGAYFKGQLGKLEKQLAQQAFSSGKYDVAFDAARNCAKYGSDDGGVGGQLKQKANELNQKADGMKKSNPNGAKGLWRQVIRMVPSGDPAYAKASKELSSSSGGGSGPKDEDE